MSKFPITPQGHEKLEKEIHHLKHVDRPIIVKDIATAREFGDLSENAEYAAAKEKQSFVETRIRELEDKLSRADIIDTSKLSTDSIKFGATVRLIDDDTKKEVTYHIVGEYEADMRLNMISIQSPMARALIGKKVGDIIEVMTPTKTKFKVYEVQDIQYKALNIDQKYYG